MSIDEKWDYLLDNNIATKQELSLCTTVAGYNDDTMDAILYALTGYRDFEQLKEEEQ